MQIKTCLLIFFVLLSELAFAQDGIMWGFEIKFKIDTAAIKKSEKFLDLEVFVDDEHFYSRSNNKLLKYNSSKNEYIILINYGDIGGVGKVQNIRCPNIYIQVNLEYDALPNEKRKYFKLIPIYFDKAERSYQRIDLGTVQLLKFFDWKDLGGNVQAPYRILQVKADQSISYKKMGEYEARIMDRLVKLKIQHEN